MIISREVDINVNRYGLRVVIPVVQYDSGRQIIFNIVDAELPSGCTSNIFIKKPSGKSVYNTCTVSGNKVTVTLTNQSLSEYGFNDAQIQIIKGEEVVTSFSFILEVKQSDADNAVISKSESTFFQGLVSKAQAAAKTCTDVLNSIPDDYSKLATNVNTNIGAIAKETIATDGSVTFTFTGNRYTAILMIQSNTFPSSGIYGLIFKKGAGSFIKSLAGNESLPTIDRNGSITFNMVSWSKAILYTTAGDEFS